MKQTFHSLVLVFLALMQCMAPLAHAHIDGHNVDRGAHIGIDISFVASQNDISSTSLSSPHSTDVIISMPPEHSSDKNSQLHHTPQRVATLTGPHADKIGAAFSQPDIHLQSISAYSLPFGQAPPV